MPDERRAAASWMLLVALVLGIQVAFVGYRHARSDDANGFLIGDCVFYRATSLSILIDRDLDIANQVADGPDVLAAVVASGQLAVDRNGHLAPKHPVVMPVLSLPFYVLGPSWGPLVFNVLVAASLVVGIGLLAGGDAAGRVVAVVALVSTPFLNYTYNYSSDLLGAALIVWGLLGAARQKGGLAGAALALAVWVKLTNAIFLPIGFLALMLQARNREPTLRFAIAAGTVLAAMGAFLWWLYGSPWTTGYQRSVTLRGTEVVMYSHTGMFTDPFLPGVWRQLFDGERGLLSTAPLWFLWPAGVALMWHERRGGAAGDRAWPWLLAAGVVGNLLVFARYTQWETSHYGNRFLFPGIALALALTGPLVREVLSRGSRWRRGSLRTSPGR